MRVVLASLALLCASLGCARTEGNPALLAIDPQSAPPPEFWGSMKAGDGRTARSSSNWMLPLWAKDRQVALAEDGKAVTTRAWSAFNLGLGFTPLLPFYFAADEARFAQSGGVAHSSIAWTPLYATGSSEGTATIAASGVPLFYGRLQVARDDLNVDLHQVLWSIGPLWAHSSLNRSDARVVASQFTPLELLGFGRWLWLSETIEGSDGREVAHGPLCGGLGYLKSEGRRQPNPIDDELGAMLREARATTTAAEPPENGPISNSELWLGGILWCSLTDTSGSGQEVAGRHGPLWTMFGYGRKDGRNRILLFWIPISV